MYRYDQIRHAHLEPTTVCQAGCPMCARNACGVTAPGLGRAELRIGDVRTILPEPFVASLTGFDLCGAYGDPAAAADLPAIVAYVRGASPNALITVYTNGGIRSPGWWASFANTLGAPGRVVFAIDGLAETNGTYRRGVSFQKVVDNARAFIQAGGEARWEFLAFRHNEADIEGARALSEELGFREFSVKKTARFLEPLYEYIPEVQGQPDIDRFPVFDAGGAVVGYLEPPEDTGLVNASMVRYEELIARYGSLDGLFSATPIRCRVLDSASVFVSATGHAYPCCWTYVQATRAELFGFPAHADRQMADLVRQTGGFERLDARTLGLRAVVEGPLFSAIERSWSCGSVQDGRLRVCARACGVDFPSYSDQFTELKLQPRGLQPQRAVSGSSLPVIPPAPAATPLPA
ncbi:hypothetical protein [Longimicrobium sp.]|uniref:hypothetical protein n=1 Tax=Longimicrobium sp. TaxID=2029185 RepID=UPI002BB4FD92|nr:hypothetical protein [Longimicrobium sp.]HSU16595.1 hypothetical protein [Longimicrobium sp.]